MSELSEENHPSRRRTDRLPESGFAAWKRVYSVENKENSSPEITFVDVELGDKSARGFKIDKLHLCIDPGCGSELVFPVAWHEKPDDMWNVMCRCPNCETYIRYDAHQSHVEVYDDKLNDGTNELMADIRKLAAERMAEDVGRFISAIYKDHIIPEDF